MNKIYIIAKNELKRYFTSPLAYVYLISFLILNGSFAIYFGHFFERGQADLRPMFDFHPWLYLLFIPGISMRLWAEEFRSKSIVQIMTMPVSTTALVWGKFLASWIFCALALFLTFPFWITVNILGAPDNGVILLSYVGSFCLAGCMLAISQTMSALTKNQVIALVLAVITNLIFFLSSLEYVLGFFRLFLPLSIVDLIASFSFITHFSSITQGLLEMRDVVFYFSILVLFNITTEIIISVKTSGTSKLLASENKKHYVAVFIFFLLGFIGLNLLANTYLRKVQYDITEEKIFTLTEATHNILKNLENPVTAKIFYSKILGDRNPAFRNYFDKLRLLLDQYRKISQGRFSYRINFVTPFDESEDYAISQGLQSLPVVDKSQAAYFGLILTDSINNQKIIPFFPLERRDYIEQDISETLYTLNNKRPLIGIISSLPLNSESIGNVITPRWEIMNRIDKFYQSQMITSPQQISSKLAALVIVHPQNLDEKMLKAIQEYSYKGGKVLLLIDIAAESINLLAPVTQKLKPSNLQNLNKIWGFHYYPQAAVTDLENSVYINASDDLNKNTNFTQDIVQFILKEKNFNPVSASTSKLKKMMFASATVIEPDNTQKIIFEPLISAGKNSAIISADLIRDGFSPAALLRNFKADNFNKIIAARISSADMTKPFDVIVIGDTDFIYDAYWGKNILIGEKQFFIPLMDNADFILNSLDLLTKNNALLNLRGQNEKIRSFDKVEELRKEGIRQTKIKEKEIMDKIDNTKAGMQEIWGKKNFEQRENFTPDELALIAGLRKHLNEQRKQLQVIQSESQNEIEKIESIIKIVNIYAIPLLILIILLTTYFWHRSKPSQQKNAPPIKSSFYLIAFASLALLLSGLYATHLSRQNEGMEKEDELVFPSLAQQINNVSQISLKSSKRELIFEKKNNLWVMKNTPDILVLQDRIRSFLTALLEARYFEKKSDKLEHLPYFGLQGFENPDSPKIEITLRDKNQKEIARLDVGTYDLDIGRGSRAAYVKQADQFQVWVASADFIDLSLEPADWTYSQLWNLRLGRLYGYNKVQNADKTSLLVSRLLNTNILSTQKQLKNPQKLFSITLYLEKGSSVDLKFYQDQKQYFVKYVFASIPTDKVLQLFEKQTHNIYYEISNESLEKIKNVI